MKDKARPPTRRQGPIGRPTAWEKRLAEYLEVKKRAGLKEQTLKDYERAIKRLFTLMKDAGLRTYPIYVGTEEVEHVKRMLPPRGANRRNQQYHLDVLEPFLKYCGNPMTREGSIRIKGNYRTNVDWLRPEQMEIIRLSVEPYPDLEMLFQMEAYQGLRRIEVLRATVHDFTDTHILVMGKGKGEGKPRTVRLHPETSMVLERFLDYREGIIRHCRRTNPYVEVPDSLFLYSRGGRLGAYQRTGLDRMLERIRTLSDIRFIGHHTLRRSFGRKMYLACKDIEIVSETLGHRDSHTTRQYLGLTLEDQRDALNAMHQEELQIRERLRMKTSIPEKLHLMEKTGM